VVLAGAFTSISVELTDTTGARLAPIQTFAPLLIPWPKILITFPPATEPEVGLIEDIESCADAALVDKTQRANIAIAKKLSDLRVRSLRIIEAEIFCIKTLSDCGVRFENISAS
jgi:hypothetical protein